MMDKFVVDNSVVMSWCFDDESNPYADKVLDHLEKSHAIVPAIWPLEVGNVLLVAERKKRLTKSASMRFLTLLAQLPIIVEQETPDRMLKEILNLARDFSISTYDASYLDLAIRRGIALATLDNGLIDAARKCNVALV